MPVIGSSYTDGINVFVFQKLTKINIGLYRDVLGTEFLDFAVQDAFIGVAKCDDPYPRNLFEHLDMMTSLGIQTYHCHPDRVVRPQGFAGGKDRPGGREVRDRTPCGNLFDEIAPIRILHFYPR
jgi:hypothetical protein